VVISGLWKMFYYNVTYILMLLEKKKVLFLYCWSEICHTLFH